MMALRTPLPTLLCIAAAAAPIAAQDQLVRQALDVIAKYEALEPTLKSGDSATAKRYLNQLGRARKRLEAAYDKTTSHWADASKRYNALVGKITAKGNGKPAPETPKPADKPADTPAEGGSGEQPAPKPAKTVDRRTLEVMNGQIYKAFHNLKSCNVRDFVDASRVTLVREQIAGFRAQLADLPQNDENVKILTGNVDSMEKLLDACLVELDKQRAPEGSAERLDAIVAFYRQPDLLPPLQLPVDAARAEEWAREFRTFRDVRMPADLAWLDSVGGKVGIDRDTWQRIRGNIASMWPMTIDRLLQQNEHNILSPARTGLMAAESILKIDPTDSHQVVNRILGEGQLDRQMHELRDARAALEVAQAYDRGLQREGAPDYAAQLATVAKAKAHLEACVSTALDRVRMPKAASEDPELVKIATETLRSEEYDVGEWTRLVINLDLRHHEKTEGTIRGTGSKTASLTLYDYAWDEMQVATAEKVEDRFWIFYNRMKRYSKGGPRTPIGKWILVDRFRTTPILEENIGK